jgi:hypothetical protein
VLLNDLNSKINWLHAEVLKGDLPFFILVGTLEDIYSVYTTTTDKEGYEGALKELSNAIEKRITTDGIQVDNEVALILQKFQGKELEVRENKEDEIKIKVLLGDHTSVDKSSPLHPIKVIKLQPFLRKMALFSFIPILISLLGALYYYRYPLSLVKKTPSDLQFFALDKKDVTSLIVPSLTRLNMASELDLVKYQLDLANEKKTEVAVTPTPTPKINIKREKVEVNVTTPLEPPGLMEDESGEKITGFYLALYDTEIRSEPSEMSAPLGKIRRGDRTRVDKFIPPMWYRVRSREGRSGFISAKALEKES